MRIDLISVGLFFCFFFFFNDTAPTEIYTLSLHDALPISRLVDASASLMLDLPQRLSPGWQPLVTITGHESDYAQHARDYSERSVVKFVVSDADNPGSMLTSIARAREIARTVRDILPR